MEVVFNNGLSASSSYTDGGVRFKKITYSNRANWRFVPMPWANEVEAWNWFVTHDGEKYDDVGVMKILFGLLRRKDKNRRHCSAACMAALGYDDRTAHMIMPPLAYTLLMQRLHEYDWSTRGEQNAA